VCVDLHLTGGLDRRWDSTSARTSTSADRAFTVSTISLRPQPVFGIARLVEVTVDKLCSVLSLAYFNAGIAIGVMLVKLGSLDVWNGRSNGIQCEDLLDALLEQLSHL
jgi:hypothetical protein